MARTVASAFQRWLGLHEIMSPGIDADMKLPRLYTCHGALAHLGSAPPSGSDDVVTIMCVASWMPKHLMVYSVQR